MSDSESASELDFESGRPTKRFKFQSYQKSLHDVHLPSALTQSTREQDIGDKQSHFREHLDRWRELNLSPAFTKFAKQVYPLSPSMVLLLHNWATIVQHWEDAISSADDEAMKPLLDLLQKLTHDLRSVLSPKYLDITTNLLKLLPRSLSATSFTALLETFSSVFKYLLIPSTEENLVSLTWQRMREVLPKSNVEVQRAVAEVWGATLRRLKSARRQEALTALASELEHVEDFAAWALVFACKSVSQTLHTASVHILSTVIDVHLSSSDNERTMKLLRRTLTALIHHCKSSAEFTTIAQYIVAKLKELVSNSSTEDDALRLGRLLDVAYFICAVRNGSRISQDDVKALTEECLRLPYSTSLHNSLLRFMAACLYAGAMPIWTSIGRRLLDHVWALSTSLAIQLFGTLSDAKWGGWAMIGRPLLLRHTMEGLQKEPREMLSLLAKLQGSKTLGEVDLVWKQQVGQWAEKELEGWTVSKDKVLRLREIVVLAPLLPSIGGPLVSIARSALQCEDAMSDYQVSPTNSAFALQCAISGIVSIGEDLGADVDLHEWAMMIVRKWPFHATLLESLLLLLERHTDSGLEFDTVYPHLAPSLLSHERKLRIAVLRLLSCKSMRKDRTLSTVQACLTAENVSLDVNGVREKVLLINRLGGTVGRDDHVSAEICARWLITQLKVNLRPLWTPAANALNRLAEAHGDTVWTLLFAELQAANHPVESSVPTWLRSGPANVPEDGIFEDEKTWRDPTAHKILVVTGTWERGSTGSINEIVEAQKSSDRLDMMTYEAQLIASLGVCHSLAEKHNRELVPMFLALAQPKDGPQLARPKMVLWLELFAKFKNPKAMYETDRLHAVYTSFLSHPDRTLQSVALSCVLTYKPLHISPHEDILRALVDDTRWRDALAKLDFEGLPTQDRAELVAVIIRLLYGVMLERRGRGRGADRRSAILSAFAGCSSEELPLLVDLMLKPFAEHEQSTGDHSWQPMPIPSNVTNKQRAGFLQLLADVLHNLASSLSTQWSRLLATTLDIAAEAQSRIAQPGAPVVQDEDQTEVDGEDAELQEDDGHTSTQITRSLRQLALKRISGFFKNVEAVDFTSFLPGMFEYIISPRLPALDRENTQAPSALLELFRVWARNRDQVHYLAHYNTSVLPRIFDCLNATNVKPSVVACIFDITESLIGFAEEDAVVLEQVLRPNVHSLLSNLVILVDRSKTSNPLPPPLPHRQLSILSNVARYVRDEQQAEVLLGLLLPMLSKSHKIVNDTAKTNILLVIDTLVPLIKTLADPASATYTQTYRSLAQLFQTLRARSGRIALVSMFNRLTEINPITSRIAPILTNLNAYSKKRMEEPDFDRRLQAFADLNDGIHAELNAHLWLPLLYNMLYFIQDPNELAIRGSASLSLRLFIDRVSAGNAAPDFEATFLRVLYPALKNGLRTKDEIVRAEVLSVLAHAVKQCVNIASLGDMRGLLADGDEEANFFNNVLHVQIHRRTRALRRLADTSDQGQLRNAPIREIFIPLVENFIVDANDTNHLLVNEAITTLGKLARRLTWGSYYALVQQYLRRTKGKDDKEGKDGKEGNERLYVRTLVAILDAFHFPMDDVVEEDIMVTAEGSTDVIEVTKPATSQKVADAVQSRLLPALLQHLQTREAAEENVRLPIAIGIAKISLYLPEVARRAQITRLITIIAQILRSKSQDTRDLVRESIRRMAIMLGPEYLPVILKELRAALTRGPQLHVLAFTVHNILVHVTSPEHQKTFEDLDACVDDAVHVSAEVVFGESGKDVAAEGFKTTMKEVRGASGKGLDTLGLVAQRIHPTHITPLLQPIRAVLHETTTQRTLNTVDDVLRRIASGLNANEFMKPQDVISLCHTLVSQNARFLQESAPQRGKFASARVGNVTVQLKRKTRDDHDHYGANSYRFVTFGLDLFNTALRRNKFDFKEPNIISRLEPMAATIGNTLYSDNGEVLIHALKASVSISKCPIKALEKSLPVYVRQMLAIIDHSGNAESDVAQASLKALATIIRDCPTSQVKEKDLVHILEVITPDIEETTRQAAVFSMLRAIVSRRFVVPEIYDAMDKVADILVTNQSSQVRESCRAILLQFLLDYPQGKGRLTNQMTFLAKNLSYQHESGRLSVMELLGAVITKFNASLLYQHTSVLFVALVMVLANDESDKCRETSATLVQGLVSRLDEQQRTIVLGYLQSWVTQTEQARLCSVAAQVYGLYVDAFHADAGDQKTPILTHMNGLLEKFATADDEELQEELEWRAPYHALVTLGKVARDFHEILTAPEAIQWQLVIDYLLFPHAWLRLASARLIGQIYAKVPVGPLMADDASSSSPISMSLGRRVAEASSDQLKSEHLEESLATQVVKNLFYLGKCFAAVPLPPRTSAGDEEADYGTSASDDEDDSETQSHPLPWLFSRLSYQLRSAQIQRRSRSSSRKNWVHQPMSILRWFAAMFTHISPESGERFLVHVLTPVYRIVEDDTIKDPHMGELKSVALELQELVQSKVGTTKFAEVYNNIRQGVVNVRRERKTTRVLMTATRPEAAAKRKLHKNHLKKDSRKRKSAALSERQGKIGKSNKRRRNE